MQACYLRSLRRTGQNRAHARMRLKAHLAAFWDRETLVYFFGVRSQALCVGLARNDIYFWKFLVKPCVHVAALQLRIHYQ